ncbi:type III secretion system gatekeeper subunit SctW [Vibrio tritonius]|uniref:Type III secretion system gatekeeper subunit SctW n=1 Tax=Vibrio tritonius TaxID=1435069 RepID=A0ABS7YMN5_9VIBR|nr:type III secretion system gatekeeper subunit SctW [Vibrio tritonius]MCA2016950.1 type III secretion system gatekeeper subunit SctW [Vibrio tritonius]
MNIQAIPNTPPQPLEPVTPLAAATKTVAPVMVNPAQDMADSMEEISMRFSENVEKSTKSLAERSIKTRSEQRVEKLAELYQMLTSQDTNTLNQEVRRLLALSQQQMQLDDLLKSVGGDPAKAEVLLQKALLQAKGSRPAEQIARLEQLSQELHEQHGAQVMAGLNTAGALAMFSQDPDNRQSLRQLYYQHVVGQASLATLFDALLTRFDEHHFAQGIHTLMRAMTDDLAAQFPSLPRGHLRVLLRDLTASQQLTNILNGVQAMLLKLSAKGMLKEMSAARLTRRLIDFTQTSLYPREVKTLSNETVGENPLAHVVLLNTLYPLIQKMPLPLWKDSKSRQSTLNLILRLMTEYAHYERQQNAQSAGSSNPQ